MGYDTIFIGAFTLDQSLTPDQAVYLEAFADTRRMARDSDLIEKQRRNIMLDSFPAK